MRQISVIRAAERDVSDADATTGLVRETAFDNGVWAGVVRTAPGKPSGWHHHGQYDTYFYMMAGEIRMEFGPGGANEIVAEPGDFVHVPGNVVHREVNPSHEEGAVILIRVGSGPPVVNVDGPDDSE